MRKLLLVAGIIIIIVGVIAAFLFSPQAQAAGGPTTTGNPATATGTTTINLITSAATIEVANPFQISVGAIVVPGIGVSNVKAYAGESLASVIVTIKNIGRVPHSPNFNAHPVSITTSPWFYTKTTSGGKDQPPVINPGETAIIKVDIYITTDSPLLSFTGLNLDIIAVDPVFQEKVI